MGKNTEINNNETGDTAYHLLNSGGEGDPPLMVRVLAPSMLPEGFTFEARINDDPDRTFTCEVPEGGVRGGQTFLIALPDSIREPRIRAPTGRWKDGLFSCFSLGPCHPALCCAIWCPILLMAQIMKRMSLTWLGSPGPRASTRNTFKVVLALLIGYIVYYMLLNIGSLQYSTKTKPSIFPVLRGIGYILIFVWARYSMCRTRQNLRALYSIPEHHCVGCEDLCCALWCVWCTVAQMARHTGEYETYKAACCTETGHPPDTPLVV